MEAQVVLNIIELLNSWWEPVKVVGILLGYLLVGIGLFSFAMSTDKSRGMSPYASIMMMIAGFLLVSLDSFLNATSYSLFDQSSKLDTLGYSKESYTDVWEKYTFLGFGVMKFLGLLSGIKGIYTLYSQANDQRQSIFTAIMFLFLAAIGLNFPHFLDMVGASLGGTVESSIDKILEYTET